MTEWSEEFPAEPGMYWFYGWQFGKKDQPPEMKLVEAFKTMTGMAYVADGHFLYKKEAVGVFSVKQAELPEPPREIKNA